MTDLVSNGAEEVLDGQKKIFSTTKPKPTGRLCSSSVDHCTQYVVDSAPRACGAFFWVSDDFLSLFFLISLAFLSHQKKTKHSFAQAVANGGGYYTRPNPLPGIGPYASSSNRSSPSSNGGGNGAVGGGGGGDVGGGGVGGRGVSESNRESIRRRRFEQSRPVMPSRSGSGEFGFGGADGSGAADDGRLSAPLAPTAGKAGRKSPLSNRESARGH